MSVVGKRVVDELCRVVSSYLGQSGQSLDLERCIDGAPVYAKGGATAICTVRMQHGCVYHLEFVYKFWAHLLEEMHYPFSPCFVISNNGLSTTLKCFLCRPSDAVSQFGHVLPVESDVYLAKNTSVVLGQDDFTKFKASLVFSKNLGVYNSMVICRTYFTDYRQVLQFLVVTPKSHKRLKSLLETVYCLAAPVADSAAQGGAGFPTNGRDARACTSDVTSVYWAGQGGRTARILGAFQWSLGRAVALVRRSWPWISAGIAFLCLGLVWMRPS